MGLLSLLMACAGVNPGDTADGNYETTSASVPAVDVTFIESESDSAHQSNEKKVTYYPTEDRYCESQMTLELEVPSSAVIPKVFVGYFSDSSGWYDTSAENLDGLDYGETLDVGASVGQAVSLSDNVSATDEEGVYEFNYTPAQDGLIDSLPWEFDLFVAATNGAEYGPIEKWTYRNASSSEDPCN